MEKYITKLNERLTKKHPEERVTKIKKRFCIVGGTILALGGAGFLAAFITFIVYFMGGDTDAALTAWVAAVPFVVLFVVGAVITRVGDKLLKKDKLIEIKIEEE